MHLAAILLRWSNREMGLKIQVGVNSIEFLPSRENQWQELLPDDLTEQDLMLIRSQIADAASKLWYRESKAKELVSEARFWNKHFRHKNG